MQRQRRHLVGVPVVVASAACRVVRRRPRRVLRVGPGFSTAAVAECGRHGAPTTPPGCSHGVARTHLPLCGATAEAKATTNALTLGPGGDQAIPTDGFAQGESARELGEPRLARELLAQTLTLQLDSSQVDTIMRRVPSCINRSDSHESERALKASDGPGRFRSQTCSFTLSYHKVALLHASLEYNIHHAFVVNAKVSARACCAGPAPGPFASYRCKVFEPCGR